MNETATRIFNAAHLLFAPGDVVEVRVPKAGKYRTISGYFTDHGKMAVAIANLEREKYPGVYWTLNPVSRDLLSRAVERTQTYAKETTSDADILRRVWLPIDLDPKRASGISSSDAEHDAALALARKIRDVLTAEGWPEMILADSGNGAHLLVRIDLPNDAEATDLCKRVLEGLAARFNTDEAPLIEVDTTTHNASRIFKAYGTVARKGDSTDERPHRLSQIMEAPSGEILPVSVDFLRHVAAFAPEPPRSAPASGGRGQWSGQQRFDLDTFLSRHGIRHRSPVAWDGGTKYVLENCPFNESHKAPDSFIAKKSDGALVFHCSHNSCSDYHWKDLREKFEGPRQVWTPRGPSIPDPPGWTSAPPSASEGRDSDKTSPVLADAEVEGQIDAAIESDDLVAAIRLAPDVGRLRPTTQAVVLAKLEQKFKKAFDKPAFKRAMAEGAGEPPEPPDDPPQSGPVEGPDLRFQPRTDSGNGERMVAMWGADIRYCHEMKSWLVWDGKRWSIDEVNAIRHKALLMVRELYKQATGSGDLEKFARESESSSALSNLLKECAAMPGIPISAKELDQQPFLLNCQNGVVDLRTGSLLPHKREFLITKLCPVKYDPKAKCERFIEFVEWAMSSPGPDAEIPENTVRLVAFLQKAFGYALTGDVGEKVLFVFYGNKGNNGKTTLLTLFRDLLGKDYSGQIAIETVMAAKSQDATMRADLADLRGARLVVTSEVEAEHKLNEGKVKYITAGLSEIKSCRKYENPIEFRATHKLFMDCNHRPRISGTDDAIWSRLRLVPFNVSVDKEKMDKSLPDKLRSELPGILAWAVRGCMQWLKEGLGAPPEVGEAGREWREHDDPLKDFLEDCCVFETPLDLQVYVLVADMASAYDLWTRQQRERFPLNRSGFNERLKAKGFDQARIWVGPEGDKKQARVWAGIELKAEVVSAIRRRESRGEDRRNGAESDPPSWATSEVPMK